MSAVDKQIGQVCTVCALLARFSEESIDHDRIFLLRNATHSEREITDRHNNNAQVNVSTVSLSRCQGTGNVGEEQVV